MGISTLGYASVYSLLRCRSVMRLRVSHAVKGLSRGRGQSDQRERRARARGGGWHPGGGAKGVGHGAGAGSLLTHNTRAQGSGSSLGCREAAPHEQRYKLPPVKCTLGLYSARDRASLTSRVRRAPAVGTVGTIDTLSTP